MPEIDELFSSKNLDDDCDSQVHLPPQFEYLSDPDRANLDELESIENINDMPEPKNHEDFEKESLFHHEPQIAMEDV